MLIAEFIFLIATLHIGSRFDGMRLGVVLGVGLCIEIFGFFRKFVESTEKNITIFISAF